MNDFPKTELGAHAAMTHLAAEMIEEGDIETGLDVIDEVRAQLVEKLQTRDTIPCQTVMKPDYDMEINKYFKHG